MTRVIVESGICGFASEITVKKLKGRKVRIEIKSGCEMVEKLGGDIESLETMSVFSGFLNNPVYRSAARHLKHVACPVPSGILKAVETEAGLSLPKNAAIVFIDEGESEK